MVFLFHLPTIWKINDKPWQIYAGDACALKIGADTVVSGYVDDVDVDFTKDDHTMTISGRSKAGQLVDCCIEGGEWSLNNQSLENIIQSILYPFGLKVIKKCSTGKLFHGDFAFEPGEKAFEAIDRACKMKGVLPISDASGNILLVQAGSEYMDTDLVFGKNIEYIGGSFSIKERYSQYTVRGQMRGSDDFNGASVAQIKGTSSDPNIKLYRPLSIIAEGTINNAGAAKRAAWEASVRLGRAGSVTVGVTGWRTAAGSLWDINKMVDVYAPPLQLNNDPLLICGATFTRSMQAGTVTALTLRKRLAYLPETWEANKFKKDTWAKKDTFSGETDLVDRVVLAVRKHCSRHKITADQAVMIWRAGVDTCERRKRRAQRALAAKEKAIVRRLRLKGTTAC
jgi:prophage tail gpP-like protein